MYTSPEGRMLMRKIASVTFIIYLQVRPRIHSFPTFQSHRRNTTDAHRCHATSEFRSSTANVHRESNVGPTSALTILSSCPTDNQRDPRQQVSIDKNTADPPWFRNLACRCDNVQLSRTRRSKFDGGRLRKVWRYEASWGNCACGISKPKDDNSM